MKQLLLVFSIFLFSHISLAQAPVKFRFQGVARDATGKIMASKSVGIRTTIRQNISADDPDFLAREVHGPITDANGVFNITIGDGIIKDGDMSTISWQDGSYYLQLELDVDGSFNYVNLGVTQMLSVPYALHTKTAEQAVTAKTSDKWIDGAPIIQSGTLGGGKVLDFLGNGVNLLWYPHNAAFRAGSHTGQWTPENLGNYSFAAGQNTLGLGTYSTAFGNNSKAQGIASTALGHFANAFGVSSLAAGSSAEANGDASVSIGEATVTKTFAGIALGAYNNVQDNPEGSAKVNAKPTDRIFQIGNGLSSQSLSNAVTILRNGNMGIGHDVLVPTHTLDIGARARIRHSAQSAGIYFDGSEITQDAFVGMKQNDQVGFYLGGMWRLWVDKQGLGYVDSGILQTSDRRLKRNFTSLSESLSKLNALQGYNYYWRDMLKDQTIQTGLIAQEVETLFPELVKTDDKGFKSVNYVGLVPHLIEAVKELHQANNKLEKENKNMLSENSKNSEAIKSLEAKLDQLLLNAASASK
ncbi:tail fiber domain-containing protein [Dyadobacter sp. LJ53]|uniref:tail fiber domain-containing protein n=1 Tax=Dyadobacter chenwenxiniae TaxID=2906456 RepID=UPI001F473A0E|nr:tail fiber domain-containing protein [Dyadobacter chenwenxiniae]MCF0051063.1 tail fiber domain-containing protein [Dyadobacter chenwenxiniae]